ncbi:MAG: hydroxymethylbilane synthase [Candidatus Hydrothermarchaeales archaeon]
MRLTIGTRGSRLALTQADIIAGLLKEKQRDLEIERKIIKTTGDKIRDAPLAKIGGKGLFVKEIDEAVVRGDVDFAVHSMKDVPTELSDGLEIVCVPEREEVNDALISREGLAIDELPMGAVIGTSSLRRRAELLNYRSDFRVKDLRGNVDTRIRKVLEGQYDAIVMAKAGLERLGLTQHITQTLPSDIFVPSVGQGAIAVVARSDFVHIDLLGAISVGEGLAGITAERALLRNLGGGCQVPIGAVTTFEDDKIILRGVVLSPDGKRKVTAVEGGDLENASEVGRMAAVQLLKGGATEILKEVYGEIPTPR